MVHPVHRAMTERLLAQIEAGGFPQADETRLSPERYTDLDWLRRESRLLFRRRPLIVAHGSELAEPGSCLTLDIPGLSAILARAGDGQLRAFVNACRHRATRLVDVPSCRLKSFVCPYHKWSYDLTGRLIGIPHKRTFSSVDPQKEGLFELPLQERHGFVWLLADRDQALDMAAYLGPIDEELDALGLADHVLHRTFAYERAANWKLIMDAFLEAYHIKTLHDETLARFFCDARALVERVGPHMRAITARRRLLEARETPVETWPIRELVTPSYLLFPNTTLIAHPDYISMITVFPLAPDRLRWVHRMLIPQAARGEAEHAHWDRTAQLIERTVFQAEDLRVAELMQRGLQAGVSAPLVFGQLEYAVPWFHRTIEQALAE